MDMGYNYLEHESYLRAVSRCIISKGGKPEEIQTTMTSLVPTTQSHLVLVMCITLCPGVEETLGSCPEGLRAPQK
jgi:hypothetical protein